MKIALPIAATTVLIAGLTSTFAFAADSDQPVSDSYITTKVKAELTKDSATSAKTIHVKTVNGIVHLTGMVTSPEEKTEAEKDAGAIKGVTKVKNDLKIKS